MKHFLLTTLLSEIGETKLDIEILEPETGIPKQAYKSGNVPRHGVANIKDQFLLAADLNKPLLRCLPIQGKEQVLHITCPGKVSVVEVSADGIFCSLGIADHIIVWNMRTGELISKLTGHYRAITCLKFSRDGSQLISGSEDARILVWDFASLFLTNEIPEPRIVWSNHTLPVTDVQIGYGDGSFLRVFSVSKDTTFKVWCLATGILLMNLSLDYSLEALAVGNSEDFAFAGSSYGKIFKISLVNDNVSNEISQVTVMDGHKDSLTCLSTSFCGKLLYSGSKDKNICVWDIVSCQCIKTIKMTGVVNNCIVIPRSYLLLNRDSKSSLTINRLAMVKNTNVSINLPVFVPPLNFLNK